jgi:hypothetical protein
VKKLTLRLDALSVETFEMMPGTRSRGTVRANAEPGCLSYENPMCTAGCTDYCETNGGGAGPTCATRCWTRNTNCDCSGAITEPWTNCP